MSVLCTSDFHLSDNPRDGYRFKTLATIRGIAKEQKVSTILFLGDVTEGKDRHSAWLVNRIVEEFYKLSKIAPVIMLQGNHDSLEIDHPFYEFLHQIEGISWVKNPVKKVVDDLGECLFLPHTRNYKVDWKDIELSGHKLVLAHNTFEGAVVETGRKMSGIPTSIFPKIKDHVVSGDIHVPQRIGGNVIYTGAPFSVDFGDDYDPRVLILGENSKLKSVRVPGPQKVLIETDVKTIKNREEPAEVLEGDIAKVRVHLKNFQYPKWHEIREEVAAYCDHFGLVLYSAHPIVEQKQIAITKTNARSDENLMREFAKISNVDDRTLLRGMKFL